MASRKRPKAPRKSICGVVHKQIPCAGCGGLIWASLHAHDGVARCTDCQGTDPGSMRATRQLAGRGEIGNPHDRQYHGDRHGFQ